MNPNKPTVLDFFEFIYDRHLIWHKRNVLKQIQPWTDDPILGKYKFCNVYRELDRCTIHLLNHVINRKTLNLETKIFNILMYRRFNVSYFYDLILPNGAVNPKQFNVTEIEKKMDLFRKECRQNLFNDAYIICQRNYIDNYRKHDKHVQQLYICKELAELATEIKKDILNCRNLEDLHTYLKITIPMTGDFIAYQYCTDLTYLFPGKWAVQSFVALGPGSKPGIQLLFPNIQKLNGMVQACKDLASLGTQAENFYTLKTKKNKDWIRICYKDAYYGGSFISLSNIQNCLCEFRKYVNLQKGIKCRKRYYRGGQ